jgi:hypothetical protein
MRALLLSVAVAAAALFVPASANAQMLYSYSPGYTTYYAPPVYYYPQTYYYPGYTTYYSPPSYWSSRYYTTPYTGGWSYQQYYPLTNQYYYTYRYGPRWGWWR